mgnify:CR=1 FL=1|jgi:chemotaxis methyl-accepting protein methylase
MSRFPGLSWAELEAFLRAFIQPDTLVFRNNKWLMSLQKVIFQN